MTCFKRVLSSRRSFAFVAALLVVSGGCSSYSDNAIDAPAPIWPLVTGLRITTDSTGSKQRALWGNPSSPDVPTAEGGTSLLVFANPFPNPSSGEVTILVGNAKPGYVNVFIARAQLAGMSGPEMQGFGAAYVGTATIPIVRDLSRGQITAGTFSFVWDGTDEAGVPLPAGYYRIYVTREGTVAWHDVLLYRSPNDIPSTVREKM